MQTETGTKPVIRPLSIIGIILLAALGGASLALLKPQTMTITQIRDKGLYVLESPRNIDNFELTDQSGSLFTNAQLEGTWSLLFFGYTFCPDICPITLATIRQFDQLLQERDAASAENLQVVMVSVDPQRDTPEKLAQYVAFFSDDYIGATGEFAALFNLARQLNVSFSFQARESGDYLVSHSGEVILVNPEGQYHGFFRASPDPALMLETWLAATDAWQDDN